MSPFHRCTVVTWSKHPPEPAVSQARALGANPTHLLGAVRPDWWAGDPWAALSDQMEAMEARLRAAAPEATIEVVLDDELAHADLGSPDLVVFAAAALDQPLARRALDSGASITWPGAEPRPVRHLVIAFPFHPANALPVAAALRTWTQPERTTLLWVGPGRGPEVPADQVAAILGWRGPLALDRIDVPITDLVAHLHRWIDEHAVDLLAVSTAATGALGGEVMLRLATSALHGAPASVLVVPGPGWVTFPSVPDAADVIDTHEPVSLRVDRVDVLGQSRPIDDEELSLVWRGETRGTLAVTDGWAVLDPAAMPHAVGLAARGDGVTTAIRVLRFAGRLGLFDAEEDPTWLAGLRAAGDDRSWVGVRLRPTRPFADLRRRLLPFGVEGVIDAGSALDEGPISDAPAEADDVRLARVARRLRLRGLQVDVVARPVKSRGFTGSSPARLGEPLEALARIERRSRRLPATLRDVLTEQTGAAPTSARGVHVELDNREARIRLLQRIALATERIHFQMYIWEDDAVGLAVTVALEDAADRGVPVRVLIDSLYGRTGSFGLTNPLVDRLERHPGIELRRIRPVQRLGLQELKRRNHRKIAVFDGQIGWVSGRNLGHTYFTGFDEVSLTASTPHRDVPWLDATAEVEGAVVRDLDHAFRREWVAAGGAGFPLLDPGPPGDLRARLVVHDGLRDAYTLDTYRTLIDRAVHHVYVVNTFPLQFELQHALLAAIGRGVEVRYLVGNVRPLHGARLPFPGGPRAAMADVANTLIHGRLDTLVAAGARAWEFGIATDLGVVLPHVHAKIVSVDGQRFTVGSANLDVTASYWESEALLLVEEPEETARIETRLDGLLAGSVPIDPNDRDWQFEAARRKWLARHWPALVG